MMFWRRDGPALVEHVGADVPNPHEGVGRAEHEMRAAYVPRRIAFQLHGGQDSAPLRGSPGEPAEALDKRGAKRIKEITLSGTEHAHKEGSHE